MLSNVIFRKKYICWDPQSQKGPTKNNPICYNSCDAEKKIKSAFFLKKG